mgnify:CR=1 FL=1|tara:strand:+ start:317 stop:838 length:522 start_codon:yes stop_codon:yes gene_type:complete
MSYRLKSAAFFLVAGFLFSPISFKAEESSSNYKVLAGQKTGYNLSTVRNLIKTGDELAMKGDLAEARKKYDKARNITKLLLGFYRDINGSFRGIDARIPRAMDAKGRKAQSLLAKTNLKLAAIFRKRNEPEVAVPLLVEALKLMTPTRPEGQQAYQSLLDLGFVQTPYAGSRN